MASTDHRKLVLQEMFETEKSYVKDLQYIVEDWLKPLRSSEIIARGQLPDVFGNIELILSVNSGLLDSLQKCLDSYPADTPGEKIFGVGEIFESQSRLLVCYHQFCSNHSRALESVSQWRKSSSKFDSFASEKEGSGLTLGSYLIKPVQRICKYPLLFRELLKFTPEDHPDRVPLETASSTLNEVTLQINEIKRQAENLSKLHDVNHQISGFPDYIVMEGRVFVKEGALSKINPKRKIQERQFFLFSDILIWCEKTGVKKNHYRYRGQLELKSSLVKEPDPLRDKAPKGMVPGSQMNVAFQIVQMSKHKVYTLLAKDGKERTEWMEVLEKVLNGTFEKEKEQQTTQTPAHAPLPNPQVPTEQQKKILAQRKSTPNLLTPPTAQTLANASNQGGVALEEDKQQGNSASDSSAEIAALEEKNKALSVKLKGAMKQLEAAKEEKEEMAKIMKDLVERLEVLEKLVGLDEEEEEE